MTNRDIQSDEGAHAELWRLFQSLPGHSEARIKKLVEQTGLEEGDLIHKLSRSHAEEWVRKEFPSYLPVSLDEDDD